MCGLRESSTPRICAISEISNVKELSKLPLNLGNLGVGGCKKCHVINMNWDHSYPTIANGQLPILRLDENMATVESVQQGMRVQMDALCMPWCPKYILSHRECISARRKVTLDPLRYNPIRPSKCGSRIPLRMPDRDRGKTLEEESVHLSAGMLLAGYRGVIATMWTIMDSDAPDVANDVYEHLFKMSPPDPAQAAEALHLAVQKLRRGSSSKKSFFHWVPFIHVGV
ncbi:hypothetical protein B0H13DRAFT_1935106 [Mycena leptocephala]|nr:hypothetical protein B0H13DRAFT_1935106 [Mycena leptocephala]